LCHLFVMTGRNLQKSLLFEQWDCTLGHRTVELNI
jgi:hypothetical protein